MRVFSREGYHRAKMEAVAEEAGIGKGTVYEYFKSKTDLFLALHDHMLAELKAFYMKELEGIRQPAAMLERFIAVAFQTFRLWEPFFLVFFDYWAGGAADASPDAPAGGLRGREERCRGHHCCRRQGRVPPLRQPAVGRRQHPCHARRAGSSVAVRPRRLRSRRHA